METFKPKYLFRGRAALLASACLIIPLKAGETRSGSGLAESEVSRRSVAMQEAQELLEKGDQAYTSARYGDAVAAYAGARDLIPDAPISAELRAAATQRYAQASVEYARELSRNGDVAGARAVVDKVLIPSVDPENPGALSMRNQLDDPIRTNPALTKEHAQDVDAVRRGLYTAEGAYNLGDYNKAKREYEAVIRIDPTNTAARRGMEKVAQAKSDYSKSAYDQTRAEMLSEVDKNWETPLTPIEEPTFDSGGMGLLNPEAISVKAKIDRIMIPKLALDQTTLEEALDFLRVRAAENDSTELDPARKGVNFTVNLGAPDSAVSKKIRSQRFDLRLSQVPLSQVLKYICEITQTSYSTDEFSVKVAPLGSTSTELVARNYRVPPDFIGTISAGAGAASAGAEDPFAETPKSGGMIPKRLGAQEALALQGVNFPQGASANYTPANNLLRVVNTEANHEFIAQIVETMTQTEPVMVSVHVTMIKVEQKRLEELGFDWLLTNFGFGGQSWIPGADKLNLSGGTSGNQRPVTDTMNPPVTPDLNPMTAGNRSGDYAITQNSIDNLLTTGSTGRQVANAAPGVFAARGIVDNATVEMIMRGLNQKTGVDVMAKPSVVTRSGQESSIAIVREFMFPDEYEPPELPNSTGDSFGGGGTTPVTPATPTSFKERDVGITLSVLPTVDDKKHFVNVALNPVFTDFDGFVNYGSPINGTTQGLLGPEDQLLTPNAILEPIFSVKRLKTEVNVADGATMVVGALMQESVQNVEDETPILGSIPIIGRLFQSKATQQTSTAIIFLVGVEVMDPTGRHYRDR